MPHSLDIAACTMLLSLMVLSAGIILDNCKMLKEDTIIKTGMGGIACSGLYIIIYVATKVLS